MKRLLRIEWLKLRHYRPFWVLSGLYVVVITVASLGTHFFLQYLKSQGADFRGIDPTIVPFYDFPDVWQNLTYIATYLKLFLAFLVIMTICNEVTYRTLRQNVIDGMSKQDWIGSKFLLLLSLALAGTILLFFSGLFTGLIWGHPESYSSIFHSIEFLFAYLLEVTTFLSFALFLALLIRRPGVVIIGLTMYTLVLEPFLALILTENLRHAINPSIWETFFGKLAHFFPIRAINNLIHVPYQRYALMEIQNYVSLREALIVMGWLAVFLYSSFWRLKKRDL
ncbi:MAG: ABC transporter permease subunit [Bacteroidota bacterium]